MIDIPASYHHRAGGLSFTDGHSEIRCWRDLRTMRPITPPYNGTYNLALNFKTPNNLDVFWLQERTTRPVR